MDAYVSRGARPAACAGEGSQEAEHGTQAVYRAQAVYSELIFGAFIKDVFRERASSL